MNNWKSRLSDKLSKMDIVTKTGCTKKQAFDSWHDFFNHSFWEYSILSETNNRYANVEKTFSVPGEEFIENKYLMDIRYTASIDCSVTANGFRPQSIFDILKFKKWLPRNRELLFSCNTNVPYPDKVLWKIRNVGEEAHRRNCYRGQIIPSNRPNNKRKETTDFFGPHFVECYVIKNGVCVARARIDVPIE